MKKKILILILCMIALLFIINIYYDLYYEHKLIIPCVFYEVTGFHCPGCGITRMVFAISRLQFYQAFRYNPLVFCLLPFIIFYAIDTCAKWIKGNKNFLYKKISDKIWIILLIITLIFGILRNIPLFKFLLPTIV